MELSAFTEEHLENIIYRLPTLKYPEVAVVTNFKQEIYLNMLESLAAYFRFGSSIISQDDLAGRLAINTRVIPPEEILQGFQLEIAPPKLAGIATIDMIYKGLQNETANRTVEGYEPREPLAPRAPMTERQSERLTQLVNDGFLSRFDYGFFRKMTHEQASKYIRLGKWRQANDQKVEPEVQPAA